jgi:uncharacterized protein YaeQ
MKKVIIKRNAIITACNLEGTKMEKVFRKTGRVMNVPFIIDDQNIFVKLYLTKMEVSITILQSITII